MRPEYSLRFNTVCVSSNKFGALCTCLDQVHGRSLRAARQRVLNLFYGLKNKHASVADPGFSRGGA